MESVGVKFSGLFTSANPYSEVPNGACEVADNVVLRDPSVFEPRRGYSASSAYDPTGIFANDLKRVFPWSGKLFAFDSVGRLYHYTRSSNTWSGSSYGTFVAPDVTNPQRAASAAKSFFFTSAAGTYQIDAPNRAALPAGILPPASLSNTTSASGTTWLGAGYSAAYRVVLCRYDVNNNLIQSAPSARLVVTNGPAAQTYASGKLSKPDGSSMVSATSTTPHGLTSGMSVVVALGGAETYFAGGTFVVASAPTATTFTYNDLMNNASGSTQTNTATDTIGVRPANATVTTALPYLGTLDFADQRATFAQLYRTFSAPPSVVPSEEYFLISEFRLSDSNFTSGSFVFQQDVTPDTSLSNPLYTNANTGGGEAAANICPPLARDICSFSGQLLHANTTEPHTIEVQLIGTSGLSNGSTVVVSGRTFTAAATESVSLNQFQLFTTGTPSVNIETTARSLAKVVSQSFALGSVGTATRVAAYYVSGETDAPGSLVIQEQGVGGASFTFAAGQVGQTCWSPDLSQSGKLSTTSDNNRQPSRVWWSPPGMPWAVPADNWTNVGAEDKAVLRVAVVRSTAFIFKEDGLFSAQFGSDGVLSVSPFDPGLLLLAPESVAVVDNQIHCYTNRGAVYVSESGVSSATSKPVNRDLLYVQGGCPQYTTSAFGVSDENEGFYLLALPISSSEVATSQQYVLHARHPSGGLTWTRWLIKNAAHGCFDPVSQSLVWCVGNKLYLERRSYTSSDFQEPDGTGIPCTIRLLRIAVGDPFYLKSFNTTFWSFKHAEFTTCTIGFDSDVGGTSSSVNRAGPTGLVWGGFAWGTNPWSASTQNYVIRVDVPQNSSSAAAIALTFATSNANAFWQLQGISLLYLPSTNYSRRG